MNIRLTPYASRRAQKRKIHKIYIAEAIKYPDKITREGARYCALKRFNGKAIEVVYERGENFIKVITVYWM